MIYLNHEITVDHTETTEYVAFDDNWLKKRVACDYKFDPEINCFDDFLVSYTSEDVDNLIGPALLEGTIAFAYCEDRDEPFEMYGDTNWHAMAVVDFVSNFLQGQGFEEASKAVDCKFEL